MNQRKLLRHRVIPWHGTRGDMLCTQPHCAPRGCQWADTPGGGSGHPPAPHHSARNCQELLLALGSPTPDQIYINPTEPVRPTPLQFDLPLLSTNTHPRETEEQSALSTAAVSMESLSQMGLLQVLKAGEKDIVLSIFTDCSLVTLCSWPPPCSYPGTEQKQRAAAWSLVILQLSSSSPWEVFSPPWGTAVVVLLLSWVKGMYPKTLAQFLGNLRSLRLYENATITHNSCG